MSLVLSTVRSASVVPLLWYLATSPSQCGGQDDDDDDSATPTEASCVAPSDQELAELMLDEAVSAYLPLPTGAYWTQVMEDAWLFENDVMITAPLSGMILLQSVSWAAVCTGQEEAFEPTCTSNGPYESCFQLFCDSYGYNTAFYLEPLPTTYRGANDSRVTTSAYYGINSYDVAETGYEVEDGRVQLDAEASTDTGRNISFSLIGDRIDEHSATMTYSLPDLFSEGALTVEFTQGVEGDIAATGTVQGEVVLTGTGGYDGMLWTWTGSCAAQG